MKNYIILFLCMLFVPFVNGDENHLGDVIVDMLIGSLIAICDNYSDCNKVLIDFTIFTIIFFIIIWSSILIINIFIPTKRVITPKYIANYISSTSRTYGGYCLIKFISRDNTL
jgi:hypothetical protein